jgi:hypothetical protein
MSNGTGKKLGCLGVVALVVAGCAFWGSGQLGQLAARHLIPRLLPVEIGDGLHIAGFEQGSVIPRPPKGVVLSLRNDRLLDMLREASPWTRLLPPGVFSDGTSLRGHWQPSDPELPGDGRLPFLLVVDNRIGYRPRLEGRFPAEDLNALFRTEWDEKLMRERDWFLGHYGLGYMIYFKTFQLSSVGDYNSVNPGSIRFIYEATGDVRIIFEDNLVEASTKAKVRRLAGWLDLHVARHPDGVGFSHEFKVTELKGDINNLAPWGDRKVSDRLSRALEKSMNRSKKRRKMRRVRLPHWTPLDAEVDVQLTPR